MPKGGLYDSHCHLQYGGYQITAEEIITKSKEKGLKYVLDVGIDIKSSISSVESAKKSDGFVKSFVGIDPQVFIPSNSEFIGFANINLEEIVSSIELLIKEEPTNIVGIGETGLDYYWTKELNELEQKKSHNLQEELFVLQILLAEKYSLPLTVHSRSAESECLEVLRKNTSKSKAIFHSFTGNYQQAKNILDQGHGIGINGIITFKKSDELRDVLKKIVGKVYVDAEPDYYYKKGIFFETDSPYLSPEGKRGEVNYPFNVVDVYTFVNQFLST